MILVGRFLGGLQGEELPKLELGAIQKHWDEAIQHNTSHVPLVLAGHFKMSDGEKLFFLPLACHSTSGFTTACGLIIYWKPMPRSVCIQGQSSVWAAKERK
jgi:hypothetical protein